MMKMLRIGTHNGTFHADEVLACALLKILPKYKESEIVRTRDPAVLETCDIVVDVGGRKNLDPKYKYQIKLSSAGLVYFHFGKEILSVLEDKQVTDPLVETLYEKVYEKFIQEIDGIDNGVETHDTEGRYTINTNFSSRIGNFNPAWNEESDDADQMKRFEKAMVQADSEFRDKVHFYAKSWWPARKIVADALEKRFQVHPSGQVLEFTQGGVPWKEHLLTLEKEQDIEGQLYYVIYADQSGKWRVQCVPISSSTFQNRLSLPEAWRGVRDEELSKLSEIPGCIFVHASGFIGGNQTREGVLQMVDVALKQQKKE